MAQQREMKTGELSEFLAILKESGVTERTVNRGHRDATWQLTPKLMRDAQDPLQRLDIEEARRIERRLFDDFSRYLFALQPQLIASRKEREQIPVLWRQLALAQHYGIPTRFLDFTTNPLVALFFAVEGPGAKDRDGNERDSMVWCVEAANRLKVWEVGVRACKNLLTPLALSAQEADIPIGNLLGVGFVPEHFDPRVGAQGSVFLYEPKHKSECLHDKIEASDRTHKMLIPSRFRKRLREQLDAVGINRASLFPDLAGVADYLRWAIWERKHGYSR